MRLFRLWYSTDYLVTSMVEPSGHATAAGHAIDDLVAAYCDAWCTPDRAARTRILDRVWDEQGTYTDPTAHVAGRAALSDHIDGFLKQYPGSKIAPTTSVDVHHDKLRFGWRFEMADGTVAIEGLDFCELSTDGKILHIVGFFGPLQARA